MLFLSMLLGSVVQARFCVRVGLCFNVVGNLRLSMCVCLLWVVVHCCWESQFKQGVVLVLGWFCQALDSQFKQAFVLVLGWISNVLGNRRLSKALC